MIFVSGKPLRPGAEFTARNHLEGGDKIPTDFECDGCSKCPDYWPPGYPEARQVPLVLACVVHDAERAYEEAHYKELTVEQYMINRIEADFRLRRNWRKLAEVYSERIKSWPRIRQWQLRVLIRVGFKLVRRFGAQRKEVA